MDFSRAAACNRTGKETSPKLMKPFHTVAAKVHPLDLDCTSWCYVAESNSVWRNRTPLSCLATGNDDSTRCRDGPAIARPNRNMFWDV